MFSDKELREVKSMLRKQYSLKNAWDSKFTKKCSYQVFRARLKELEFDARAEQQLGLSSLKAQAFGIIDDMDPEKQFNAALKFLERYEDVDDDTSEAVDTGESITNIVDRLKKELG